MCVFGAVLMASPSYAQDAAATAPAPTNSAPTTVDAGQKDADTVIVVTGSSIRRANLETPSPLQIVTATDLAHSGYDSITSVLTNLTANGQGTLSANNSEAFAGGAAGIALRGLTVGDTLTLIDGHRLAPYPLSDDGERQFTDVQGIPFNAVESVDILKDGASSIYGSDAIAGVINIHLKKEIIGFEAMAEGSLTQHGGGATQHYGLSYGVGKLSRDGYNAFVTVEYRKQDAINISQRQNEPWGSDNFASLGGNNLAPGEPSIINSFLPATRSPYLINPNIANPTVANGGIVFLGQPCDLAGGGCATKPNQVLQSPTQNLNITVGVTKDFGDSWELKIRGSYWESKGQQTGSSPYGGWYESYPGASYLGQTSNPLVGLPVTGVGATSFLLPANFPGNTTGGQAYLQGFLPQLGVAAINFDSRTIRLAIDVTGKIAGWDVTGSVGMSNIDLRSTYDNFVNFDTLYSQLTTFYAQGQPLFNPLGGNSQAELNLIAPRFGSSASDALYYVEATGTRKLLDLPGGDLHVAVGGTFIDKQLHNPGAAEVLSGVIGPPAFSDFAIGGQTDTAGFFEFDATMFHTLDLNVSGRDDYYDTYGNSFTPKVGATWHPVSPLLLRGTFSKGFRAPSPAEVGQAGSLFSLGEFADPLLCPNGSGGPFPKGTVPASCVAAPAYAQRTNSLKPEKSTSFTGGFVLTPVRGFSFTADYYHIKINNEIVSEAELPSYSSSLGQLNGPCLRGPDTAISGVSTGAVNADGTPQTTTAVPLYGALAACIAGYVNAQSTVTSGLDLEAHYRLHVGRAAFTASATYTHEFNYDLTAPNGQTYHLAGTHGPTGVSGDTGNPRDHINASVTGEYGPFSATISGYWISSFSIIDPSAGLTTCAAALGSAYMFAGQIGSTLTPTESSFCRVKSFTSINLQASYKITSNFTINGGINNLFDATAPIDAQTYAGGFTPYNPSLHEDGVIGRLFRLGVDFKY